MSGLLGPGPFLAPSDGRRCRAQAQSSLFMGWTPAVSHLWFLVLVPLITSLLGSAVTEVTTVTCPPDTLCYPIPPCGPLPACLPVRVVDAWPLPGVRRGRRGQKWLYPLGFSTEAAGMWVVGLNWGARGHAVHPREGQSPSCSCSGKRPGSQGLSCSWTESKQMPFWCPRKVNRSSPGLGCGWSSGVAQSRLASVLRVSVTASRPGGLSRGHSAPGRPPEAGWSINNECGVSQ